MKSIIYNLINELVEYSEKLENINLFVENPWVLIDDDSNYHKYIFRRNGDLVMAINGSVSIGKWEYIATSRCLLVNRVSDTILLNQTFIDSAVMALKIDGPQNKAMILANENLIPDLDVKKYLQEIVYRRFNVIKGIVNNGKLLEIYRGSNETGILVGMKAKIEGEAPDDGNYRSQESGILYEIRNSKIFKITYPHKYITVDGVVLEIHQHQRYSYSKGDIVYINDAPASSGIYKLGFLSKLTVMNGIIIKTSMLKVMSQ
jgi:hypothetical protein